MQTLQDGDNVVVALAPGEEIIASLTAVAEQFKIGGGSIHGLGSVSEVEIAFFDPEKKEYIPRTFEEPMEIGSLAGNFSKMGGNRFVHCHITVAGPELIAFTGHLNRGIVGTACEIYIRRLSQSVLRIKDPDAGFNPLHLT
ncbi:MAG: PPC domain-containing DNA-binding protein [Planctomycetota bacterium]|jgi:predicted DNA-binding protein with PD1-like motif